MKLDRLAGRGVAALAVLFPLLATTASAEIPRPFRYMLKGMRMRAILEIPIGGETWEGYRPFSDLPFLAWPADQGATPPVAKDHEAVRRWIASLGGTLGHADFAPVFVEQLPWLGIELWSYRLERRGAELWNASVQVYWDGDVLVGIVNDVPGVLTRIPDGVPADDSVYMPRRVGRGRYELDLVRRVTTSTPDGGTLTTFAGPSAPNVTVIQLPLGGARMMSEVPGAEFTEWPMPPGLGSFPDQIDTDSQGRVWFSQPLDNKLTLFDPTSETFTAFPVTAGDGPDGLMVSSADEVWSGLYFSGDLGRYDPVNNVHFAIPAPYAGAALAIPTETSHGTVIVTDHAGKVLEWDIASSQWIKNVNTPSPSPHIVAGVEDESERIWFTEFNTNALASLDLNTGVMQEFPVPGGGGPAFPAYSNGRVFFSLWNQARLGAYDPALGTFTFWNYAPTGEVGGPIFTAPNGDVALGTRGDGYIFIYRALTGTLTGYEIPTSFPQLKDGLTVAPDGAVWFTESGVNRVARFTYPH